METGWNNYKVSGRYRFAGQMFAKNQIGEIIKLPELEPFIRKMIVIICTVTGDTIY